jgi:predicted nucleic acid-binding protein
MGRPKRPGIHRGVRETASTAYAAKALEGLTAVVLDSDIVIDWLRGEPRISSALGALEDAGVRTYCTPVTWAEVWAGVRRGEEHVTESFFEARGTLLLDAAVGRRAGEYLSRFAKSHALDLADALIAAAASVNAMPLWTRNRKHYPMSDLRFYESR